MPNCQPDIRIIWGDDTGISNLSCCKAVSWAIAGPTSTESPQKASDSPTGTQPSGARRSGHREGRRRHDAPTPGLHALGASSSLTAVLIGATMAILDLPYAFKEALVTFITSCIRSRRDLLGDRWGIVRPPARLDAAGVGRRSDRRRTQACHAAPTAGRFLCGIARR